MPIIELCVPHKERQGRSNNLRKFHRNVYSQGGEDGMLAEVFRIITPKSRWCVEFGAWDGQENSNTCHLIKGDGWSAVLIEGNADRFADIKMKTFPSLRRVHALNKMVGFTKGQDTLDDYLKTTPIPKDFDLLVIDIDGADYHVWESIDEYRPRVVLIEINGAIPNAVRFIQDRDMTIHHGSSLLAMIELGKRKGYELVGTSATNAFFVVKEEFEKFCILDNSIDAMKISPDSYIFPLPDGMLVNTMGRLPGKARNLELKWDSIQVLSTFQFHGQITGQAANHIPRQPTSGPIPLDTAEQIVLEDAFLRANINTLPKHEYNARQKSLITAKNNFVRLKRDWPEAAE